MEMIYNTHKSIIQHYSIIIYLFFEISKRTITTLLLNGRHSIHFSILYEKLILVLLYPKITKSVNGIFSDKQYVILKILPFTKWPLS